MNRDVRPARVLDYQLACLRAELEFLTRPDAPRPGLPGFLRRHALQLYWTLTRFAGLSHWHDGTNWAAKRQPLAVDLAHGVPDGAHGSIDAARPRLLIDISTTVFIAESTGIQVVVREFAAACYRSGVGLPVFISKGEVFSALEPPGSPALALRPGDCLFLLDASWSIVDDVLVVADRLDAVGGSLAACIYDLVPFLQPAMCPPGVVAAYTQWFERIRPRCRTFFCISRTVAGELERYLERADGPDGRAVTVAWFDLGVRGNLPVDESAPGRLSDICRPETTYLSVGTLEPRKGYPVALAAFDRLWADGCDVDYLILGRRGWNTRHVERAILTHPLYGTRLHWIADASDADLAYAYGHARALVAPSIAEGFGLPLVEAAHFGLGRILSDIPIFREVAGANARYFDVCDDAALARAIASDRAETAAPRRVAEPSFDWAASALRLREIIWSRAPAPTDRDPPPAPR